MKTAEEDRKLKPIPKIDYHSARFFAILFPSVYAISVAIFCLEYKIIPGPEFLALALLVYGAYNKKTCLGEHYVVDVLAGILFASAAFVLVEKLLPLLAEKIGFLGKQMPNQAQC